MRRVIELKPEETENLQKSDPEDKLKTSKNLTQRTN
jgi:hypothetical protein